jgi:hypothetical protein
MKRNLACDPVILNLHIATSLKLAIKIKTIRHRSAGISIEKVLVGLTV